MSASGRCPHGYEIGKPPSCDECYTELARQMRAQTPDPINPAQVAPERRRTAGSDTVSDGELAARLLATPTGCCTSLAYALFRKYKSPRDPLYGPFDDEVIANLRKLAGDKIGETPEQILNRLAACLNCEPRQAEPRQVADRVIRMLEERAKHDH